MNYYLGETSAGEDFASGAKITADLITTGAQVGKDFKEIFNPKTKKIEKVIIKKPDNTVYYIAAGVGLIALISIIYMKAR